MEYLIAIAMGIVGIIFLIIFVLIFKKCRGKHRRRHEMINNETHKDHIVLNSTRNATEMSEFKRGSKLSNLEVNQREVPIGHHPRPVSYTPSSQNDPLYNGPAMVLNNLDTLRSYGSAGDELENVPLDYVKNLNRNTVQGGLSNHCDSEKTTWADQMHLEKSKKRNGE